MGRPFLFRWEAEEHDSIVIIIIIIIVIIIIIIIIIPNTRRDGEFYFNFLSRGRQRNIYHCRIKYHPLGQEVQHFPSLLCLLMVVSLH